MLLGMARAESKAEAEGGLSQHAVGCKRPGSDMAPVLQHFLACNVMKGMNAGRGLDLGLARNVQLWHMHACRMQRPLRGVQLSPAVRSA